MELGGKTALVTGGAKRVGRGICLALARAGADVAVHYGSSADEALKLADEIRGMGRRAATFAADLSQPPQIEAMFVELSRVMPRLDVLVNCAAVYHRTPLETLTAQQWDAEMAVNARAPALCIRHAMPLMAGGGAIINISDSAAEKGPPNYPAYCASKAAVEALTRSAARALAARNIRVNAVAPGVAAWPADVAGEELEQLRRRTLKLVPMGREGTPEDIASAVVFLAASDYITAQILRVDGGWNMG